MTMTFIIIYVVIALILIGGLNFFVIKRKKKKTSRTLEQSKHESIASNESYQSKFKVKSDETSTDASVKNTTAQENNETNNLNRSEEHTSELQSRFDLVCRLLLE